MRFFVGLVAVAAVLALSPAAEAARPRRPSAAQIKKMNDEMASRQREMARVQAERAAKEKEIFDQFDENKDGKLIGPEKSKHAHHMEMIRTGKVPNPFATILPPGQGPRTAGGTTAKK